MRPCSTSTVSMAFFTSFLAARGALPRFVTADAVKDTVPSSSLMARSASRPVQPQPPSVASPTSRVSLPSSSSSSRRYATPYSPVFQPRPPLVAMASALVCWLSSFAARITSSALSRKRHWSMICRALVKATSPSPRSRDSSNPTFPSSSIASISTVSSSRMASASSSLVSRYPAVGASSVPPFVSGSRRPLSTASRRRRTAATAPPPQRSTVRGCRVHQPAPFATPRAPAPSTASSSCGSA
mmetsp:Transcript_38377/g.120304  ORF Transcript_38377/g.120304 Transcript_38377/m.120304 type:complete len:242 (+) Transcript_38377:1218-1943(+)